MCLSVLTLQNYGRTNIQLGTINLHPCVSVVIKIVTSNDVTIVDKVFKFVVFDVKNGIPLKQKPVTCLPNPKNFILFGFSDFWGEVR